MREKNEDKKRRSELIKQLLKEYQPKNATELQDMLKDLLGDTLQGMLETEMDDKLGYSKYDYKNKETENSRNGYSKKTVTSNLGDLEINVSRDREGEFEPQVVKKHQNDVSGIDEQIISMYAKGMSTRDIETHLKDVYGVNASSTLISKITDKILPLAREWQSRPLESVYAIVFLDALHCSVRKDGQVVKKAVYIALGITLEGFKEILGMWIGENESSRFWLNVLNEMKNRGTKDILIASVDNLAGFSEAIKAVFPKTEIQKCIIHQIRNSTKYVSYKDIKQFMADLKLVYQAATEAQALDMLDRMDEKWGQKYPSSIKSWRANWNELATFFKYPGELRRIIYTTNSIENFNRQMRKVTKTRSSFPDDESLFKLLYLGMMDVTRKWTGKIYGWCQILDQLAIYFEGRVELND
ncbi:MAG: Transposase, Mutator family [bacterium ADurb.Bin243]|nr:MAG: Transposase, Mutator family [bacterium ADurb.Bin243]